MVCDAAGVDELLERARGVLLLSYEACRRAREGPGLAQEVVVTSRRTLDELEDVIADIRALLVVGPGPRARGAARR